MFILEQIKQAYDKVQTATDFENYIQELIELGIKGYDTLVTDGRVVYYGDTNHEAATDKNTINYPSLQQQIKSALLNTLSFMKVVKPTIILFANKRRNVVLPSGALTSSR